MDVAPQEFRPVALQNRVVLNNVAQLRIRLFGVADLFADLLEEQVNFYGENLTSFAFQALRQKRCLCYQATVF